MQINHELKRMLESALGLLAGCLVVLNLVSLNPHHYLATATVSSQRLALNRLKPPHLNQASEHGKYPRLSSHDKVKLIALRKQNRLYVIRNHQVIYLMNAQINFKPTTTVINAAHGTAAIHVNYQHQQMGTNWTSFGQIGYLEAPFSIQGHRVHGNWLRLKATIPNTIEVSRPDAHWLQQIPQGTALTIK